MPRGDLIARRMRDRIADSPFSLTVVYPPKRLTVVDTSPGAAPVSPLTGVRPEPKLTAATPTPAGDSIDMPCLWLDATTATDLRRNGQSAQLQGWMTGADVMATVLVEDAAVDPLVPEGDTKFDGCAYVEKSGKRYDVMKVTPVGSSFAPAHVYYIWLKGARRQ